MPVSVWMRPLAAIDRMWLAPRDARLRSNGTPVLRPPGMYGDAMTTRAWVRLDRFEQATDVVGAVAEVAVDHDEVVGRAAVERGAQRLAEQEVDAVAQHADARRASLARSLGESAGAVGAAVVDDDDLPAVPVVERVHVVDERVQRLDDDRRLVERGHDHRDRRLGRRRRCTRSASAFVRRSVTGGSPRRATRGATGRRAPGITIGSARAGAATRRARRRCRSRSARRAGRGSRRRARASPCRSSPCRGRTRAIARRRRRGSRAGATGSTARPRDLCTTTSAVRK